MSLEDGRFLITVRPSFLLRVPGESRSAELTRFIKDLKLVA